MRDIIYITTAQEEQEFDQFKKGWKFSLNPSNINFNNKMISCFSLTNKVHVFSIRPYSKRQDSSYILLFIQLGWVFCCKL